MMNKNIVNCKVIFMITDIANNNITNFLEV
jgi:hypothetical protein